MKFMMEHNADIQAIRRNPLIVGFAEGPVPESKAPAAVFGWLIGPRFQTSNDGLGFQYRHVSAQHALNALVSLPSAWPQVKIQVETSWLKEDHTELDANGMPLSKNIGTSGESGGDIGSGRPLSYNVRLPSDFGKFTDALSADSGSGRGTAPSVFGSQLDEIKVRVEQPAEVLIPGRNLWRSTVVTIGAQQSNRITVLPNMEGIVAHFNKIKRPADWPDRNEPATAKVRIWTSAGSLELPLLAKIYSEPKKENAE